MPDETSSQLNAEAYKTMLADFLKAEIKLKRSVASMLESITKGRIPATDQMTTVYKGVVGKDLDGSYSAALETDEGRLVLQGARRTDRPSDDPQTIAVDTDAAQSIETSVHLCGIVAAIDASRRMLELGADWDDEGAEAISEATWQRATQFLLQHAKSAQDRQSLVLPTPSIQPVSDGSVDLHWETDEYELLVNVPADAKQHATFYGDNLRGKAVIKGHLDISQVSLGVLSWLLPT